MGSASTGDAIRSISQFGNSFAQRAEFNRVRLEPLTAGEGEQLPDQLAALLGGALGHRQHLKVVLGKRCAPLYQAQTANDRREKVVEVVRHAASQLADGIHLLGLNQLAFERSLLANVSQRAGKFDGLAVGVFQQDRLVQEVLVAVVRALPAILYR